ncbi:MAG: hypothetical protein CM1200mP15_22530 [Dehalococcoidia bacterium]|nr:MAG: hypothetical protein CM1200mP15_22530 [Dehalococcoidia bacterium]
MTEKPPDKILSETWLPSKVYVIIGGVICRLELFFPQNEIGSDPVAVRDFAQAAEEKG